MCTVRVIETWGPSCSYRKCDLCSVHAFPRALCMNNTALTSSWEARAHHTGFQSHQAFSSDNPSFNRPPPPPAAPSSLWQLLWSATAGPIGWALAYISVSNSVPQLVFPPLKHPYEDVWGACSSDDARPKFPNEVWKGPAVSMWVRCPRVNQTPTGGGKYVRR